MGEQLKARIPVLIFGIILTVGCVVGTALFFRESGGCSVETQSIIERRIHIAFPPSAQNIDCGFIFMQGSEVWARFEMSPKELDTFIASTAVSSLRERAIPHYAKFRYDIKDVSDYLYGEYRGAWSSGHMSQFILIDTLDPQVYVVYFEALFSDD